MGITVEPYEDRHVPAVMALNSRLAEHVEELMERFGGAAHSRLPEAVEPAWLPPRPGSSLRQELFVAVQDGDAVRGGFTLKHQEFSFRGETATLAGWHEPVSEGIVDKRYGLVGTMLVRDALKRSPRLICTAMGGLDLALPRLLSALGWSLALASFQFFVHRPFRFLRGLEHLRRTRRMALLCDLAAFTGLGWAGVRAAQRRGGHRVPEAVWTIEESFGPWADELWDRCKARYALAAVRTSDVLNRLYPKPDTRFGPDIGPCHVILRVRSGEATVGWALVIRAQMHGGPFGKLQVGTIVDCLAEDEHVPAVVGAATRYLGSEGVDLTYTNQFARVWHDGLQEAGYFEGPSNFGLALSPQAVELLGDFDKSLSDIHITRGDGEGPVHRRTLATATLLPPSRR